MALLERIAPSADDRIIYLGDYVNKGPHSLKVIRYLANSGSICLMGNHELSWIHASDSSTPLPSMEGLWSAEDCDYLLYWMRKLPWAYLDEPNKALMVHAGIDPLWTLSQALQIAKTSSYLAMNHEFIAHLRRQELVDDNLRNAWIMTNIRYYKPDGSLSNNTHLPPQPHLTPWFELPHRHEGYRVYFGHWARLEAKYQSKDYCNLDGGIAYGKNLFAYHLEKHQSIYQSIEARDLHAC